MLKVELLKASPVQCGVVCLGVCIILTIPTAGKPQYILLCIVELHVTVKNIILLRNNAFMANILRRQRETYLCFHVNYFCAILNKFRFARHIVMKVLNRKCPGNRSNGSRSDTSGETDGRT